MRSVVSTLRTTCIIICRPFLPGYFPAMFSADKLKRLAPVSLQMAWTSIFFPTPDGPASSSDFTKGAFWCTSAEPARGRGPSSKSRQEARGSQTRLPRGHGPTHDPGFCDCDDCAHSISASAASETLGFVVEVEP